MAMTKSELPPICTHNMLDPSDHVLNALRRTQLINNPSDRVKVIFHPGKRNNFHLSFSSRSMNHTVRL